MFPGSLELGSRFRVNLPKLPFPSNSALGGSLAAPKLVHRYQLILDHGSAALPSMSTAAPGSAFA